MLPTVRGCRFSLSGSLPQLPFTPASKIPLSPPSKIRHFIPESHLPTVKATLAAHDLELRDDIGHGGFASVYTAYHSRYQRLLAVKITALAQTSWSVEFNTLRELCHPNIVQLYDVFQDGSYFYFVLEYCSGGTLLDRMKNGQPFGAKEFKDVATRLLEAPAHCHSKGIAHLDIKPENVLYGADGKIRLADFGCAQREVQTFFGGSVPYMAPEMLCKVGSSNPFSADIWSLGITFYHMVYGKLPWNSIDTKGMSAEIRLGSCQPPPGVDQRIAGVIMKMVKLEPRQRASPDDLLEVLSGWKLGTSVTMLTPITQLGAFRGRRLSKGPNAGGVVTSLSFAGSAVFGDADLDGH